MATLNKNNMNFEELVRDHSADMIEKLVTYVVSQDPVEVRFDFLEQDQWAMITMFEYEEDKEVSVRLHPGDKYELYFGYYDDEDEFFEITHDFTEEEKKDPTGRSEESNEESAG